MVAILLAIVAGGSFIIYSNHLDNRLSIVVASQDIEAGTVITSNMLTLAQIHPDAVVANSFTSSQELIGKETTTFIGQGEQIVSHRLSESQRQGNGTIAETLPAGKVALGVPTSLVYSAGGQIKPNNKVIIYGINPGTFSAIEIAKDIPVMKILNKTGDELGIPADKGKSKSNQANGEPVVIVVELEEEIAGIVTTYMATDQIIFAIQSEQQ